MLQQLLLFAVVVAVLVADVVEFTLMLGLHASQLLSNEGLEPLLVDIDVISGRFAVHFVTYLCRGVTIFVRII